MYYQEIKKTIFLTIITFIISANFISASLPNLYDGTEGLPSLDSAFLSNNTYNVNYSVYNSYYNITGNMNPFNQVLNTTSDVEFNSVTSSDFFGNINWSYIQNVPEYYPLSNPYNYYNSSDGVLSQWTTTGSDIYYNTGSVGIGTTSPDVALDTTLAGTAQSITTALQLHTTAVNGVSELGTGTAIDFRHHTTANVERIVARIVAINEGTMAGSSKNDAGLAFYTVDGSVSTTPAERMRISAGGNVGIGTTSPTLGRLEIKQSADSNVGGLAITDVDVSANARMFINSNNAFVINSLSAGTGNIILNEGVGKIGIGTSTPQNELNVIGTGNFTTGLILGSPTNSINITMYSPDGTAWSCGVTNGGAFSCI